MKTADSSTDQLILVDSIGKVDSDEIKAWKFIEIEDLKKQVLSNPGKFTPWFRLSLDRVLTARALNP